MTKPVQEPEQLAPRAISSHKGDYGRVYIVGGSVGMSGAVALAGQAALASGAGLVTLAVPTSIQSTVAGFHAAYMTRGLPANRAGGIRSDASQVVLGVDPPPDAYAVGPGLGRSLGAAAVARRLFRCVPRPMVVDADGLNAIALTDEVSRTVAGPRILTPHPGEFDRLFGEGHCREARGTTKERIEVATRLAARSPSGQMIVVLKGHETVICDGERHAVNSTGNPGMATGGTGDCLTGIIVALVGQGLSPFGAAHLGTLVHGRAGDLASAAVGQTALTATTLLDYLPAAFKSYVG